MKQKLINGWLFRSFTNHTMNAWVNVNLFVLVWGGETTPLQRALFVIIADAVGMVWSTLCESRSLRKWFMDHFWIIFWGLAIADAALTPLILWSPYGYFIIFTVFVHGAWSFAFMTLMGEVREVLLTTPNSRNKFQARMMKVFGAGKVTGGVLSIVLPVAEWGLPCVIASVIISNLLCCVTTSFIFSKTLKYMNRKHLSFPCNSPDPDDGADLNIYDGET